MDKLAEILSALLNHKLVFVSHGGGQYMNCRQGRLTEVIPDDEHGRMTINCARYIVSAESHEIEIRPSELSIVLSRTNIFSDSLATAIVFCPPEENAWRTVEILQAAKQALAEAEAR